MKVILIAAITVDGYISRHNLDEVDWSLDLPLFKKQTMGHPVIMGVNTKKTLQVDLTGRKEIIVHRKDNPKKILKNIKDETCFVIGGGMTNSLFSPYLTHLFLTIHPLVFGKGVKLFKSLQKEIELTLVRTIEVKGEQFLYQFQYRVS